MRILVDADACPVQKIIEYEAEKHGMEVFLFCDVNHDLLAEWGKVVIVDPGKDAVDLALLNRTKPGDLVVTQDYGLAAMALAMGTHCLHPSGMSYTAANIDTLLCERHLAARARRGGQRMKGPKKRTAHQDQAFQDALVSLLNTHQLPTN